MGTLFLYLLAFLLYMVLQALFINGIFISSRGSDEVLPDGTVRHSEMILSWLNRYLNASSFRPVYFTLARITKIVSLEVFIKAIVFERIYSIENNEFKLKVIATESDLENIKNWADRVLNAKIFYNAEKNTVKFYQDIEFYRFSKYIRKPIIGCIVCMSSFWSIFMFLIPCFCYFGWHPIIFLIEIANVVCLSYLNYVVFKITK